MFNRQAASRSEMGSSALIIGSFLGTAPLDRYVSGALARRLSERGWRVLITSRRQGRLPRLVDMVKTTWTKRGEYTVALMDVFSGPAFFCAEVVSLVLRRLGKPFALTLHGGNLPAFSRRWPTRVRRLLASAVSVTTPSAYLLEQMEPYCAGLRLIPNPVDVAQHEFRLREHPQPALVWVRAFHKIYNPCLALRALADLRHYFPAAQLVMTGPDKGDGTMAQVRAAVAECELEDAVRLAGPLPKSEIPTVLSQGDIFLNTTNFDNTPVSVLEAMACGLCVVSTNVGGIPYLLQDAQDALLVPPNDPLAMVAAVRKILTEPGLAAHLSRSARNKAEGFDWSVIIPQWETLLNEVIAKAAPRQA